MAALPLTAQAFPLPTSEAGAVSLQGPRQVFQEGASIFSALKSNQFSISVSSGKWVSFLALATLSRAG